MSTVIVTPADAPDAAPRFALGCACDAAPRPARPRRIRSYADLHETDAPAEGADTPERD